MGLAERRKKDSAHAQYMKKMGIERGVFRCFCGSLVGIGLTKVLQHFASGNCK